MTQRRQRVRPRSDVAVTGARRSQIGRFTLVHVLGSGGFATVYLAEDSLLRRQVALKLLHEHLANDAYTVRRFQAEARAGANLRHPNIVHVYDIGESAGGRPYLVTEFLSGSPLSRVLAESGPLSVDLVARIIQQLASALAYMHGQRIVHRDVKPSNVMLGESGHVTLMDFGSARELTRETRQTLTRELLGTLSYMEPEQIEDGAITPTTDIYALGLLAYELLTGEPAFAGSPARVMHDQVYTPAPRVRERNARVPLTMDRAIAAALAKAPGERPPSVMDFANRFTAPQEHPQARRPRTGEKELQPATAVWPDGVAAAETAILGRAGNGHGLMDESARTPAPLRRVVLAWSGAGALILGIFLLAFLGVSQLSGRGRTATASQNRAPAATPKVSRPPAVAAAPERPVAASTPTPLARQSAAQPSATRPAVAESPASCTAGIGGQWQFADLIRYGNGAGQQYTFNVRLAQQGDQVTGSGTLSLAGQLDGCVLHATFAQPGGAGEFTWSFAPDGSQFTGTFSAPSFGNGGDSAGRRLGSS